MRCGSVWSCPECAAIIARGRIEEIRAGMLTAERLGWGACWQTLTLPHDAPDRLEQSLELVAEGWRRIRRRSGWAKLAARLRVRGTIRKVEVTHGESGWHPHLHLTFLTERPLIELELEELERFVWLAWRELVTAAGYREPRLELCPLFELKLDSKRWAEYIGKMLGYELAGQRKKTRSLVGRTPFELLEDACAVASDHNGNARIIAGSREVALWREYEQTTRGRRQLSWSHGLKAVLEVLERSDEEALELGDGLLSESEETVALLVPAEWAVLWKAPGRLEALLTVAADPSPLEERQRLVRWFLSGWIASDGDPVTWQ